MAQCSSPSLLASGNAPVVKPFLGVMPPQTANTPVAIALSPSGALLSNILIRIDVAGAETFGISGVTFGGDTVIASKMPLIALTTGAPVGAVQGNPVAASALTTGNYMIPRDAGADIFASLIFTKSLAVQIGTAAVSCAYDQQANL